MLTSLRRACGLQLARWRYQKEEDPPIPLSRFFSDAHRALIVMPLWVENPASPHELLMMLKDKYREENLTIITGTQETFLAHFLPRSTILRLHRPDLGTFLLPGATLRSSIAAQKYDIALDLNLDFVLPSAYICRESNARVRVGFARKNADLFFNVQVQRNEDLDVKSLYDRLAACLQMF
jgi:hypothetical protein